jgi:hypothetical protein
MTTLAFVLWMLGYPTVVIYAFNSQLIGQKKTDWWVVIILYVNIAILLWFNR